MVIVHSCTSKSFSGLERYVLTLAQLQKEQGMDVVLFVRGHTPLAQQAAESGLVVRCVPHRMPWFLGAVTSVWFFWCSLLFAKGLSERFVLHLHHAGELRWHRLVASAAKRFVSIKVVLHFHLWIEHDKHDAFHRWLYRVVDQIWAGAPAVVEQLKTILPVEERKFVSVPYARDFRRLKQLEAQAKVAAASGQSWRGIWNIPEDAPIGFCASRIEPIKGVRELVEAFGILSAHIDRAYLVLVGGVSPQDASAERLNLEIDGIISNWPESQRQRLIRTGPLPEVDLLKLLAVSDFYVLPSYQECVSLALVDAMALGKAVVGTASGGTPSLVVAGESGIPVKPRDVSSLVGAMEALYLRPLKRQALSEGAKKKVQEFDQDHVIGRVASLYRL